MADVSLLLVLDINKESIILGSLIILLLLHLFIKIDLKKHILMYLHKYLVQESLTIIADVVDGFFLDVVFTFVEKINVFKISYDVQILADNYGGIVLCFFKKDGKKSILDATEPSSDFSVKQLHLSFIS